MLTIPRNFPLLFVIGAMALGSNRAGAVILTDLNAKIEVDPTTQDGMKEWSIAGQNQVFQQWFWYRLPGVGQNQYSIQTGTTLTQTTTGTDKLNLKFTYGSSFTMDIFYDLNGTVSDTASLIQSVGITNLTGSSLVLDFYQYNNFNLGGDAGGDTIFMESNYAEQTDGGLFVTEGGVQPPSSFFEANTVGGPGSTLSKLNSSLDLDLNSSNGSSLILSDDVTWAFQWHIELDPGEGVDIIKNQNLYISLVPEPSTLSLGVLALALLGYARKNRRA